MLNTKYRIGDKLLLKTAALDDGDWEFKDVLSKKCVVVEICSILENTKEEEYRYELRFLTNVDDLDGWMVSEEQISSWFHKLGKGEASMRFVDLLDGSSIL